MNRDTPQRAMTRHAIRGLIGTMLVLTMPSALAAAVMYGGLGGHGVTSGPQASTNDGALVIVSQTDGSTTVVGHPAGVARISGLAFGLDGTLYGATQVAGGYPPPYEGISTSALIRLDPDTGALISSVPISEGATQINIADLAVQPGSGTLYGIRGPNDQLGGEGKLYTINTTTGAATLVGSTGGYFGSIAFAPDGKLYMSWATLGPQGAANPHLLTLDPTNASVHSDIPGGAFYSALAVRPTDGVMFGGTGDQQGVYAINPASGATTLLGKTGTNLVGDFAFRPEAPPVVIAVEYRHPEWDHYFVTTIADEITKLDNGTFAGWVRTGEAFAVYALNTPGGFAVCRFFSTSFAPRSSHFYTPFAAECDKVRTSPDWQFEGLVFSVGLPDAAAKCAAGTRPLYRIYNNGQGAAPNHRYTTSLALRSNMLGQGWIPEGSGDLGVIACVPV